MANCTIVDNTVTQGAGGVDDITVIYNSIIYDNTVITSGYPNCGGGIVLVNCCTTSSINNIDTITNDPGFVEDTDGNFNLASNSLCINGGGNAYIVNLLANDLNGNTRITDGLVDIGAYEYQTALFVLPYYWAQEYGLSVTNGVMTDPYADGMNYWWIAVTGANPTNSSSILKVSVSNSVSGVVLTWPGMQNAVYCLQRSTNLLANPAFVPIYTNSFPFVAKTLSFIDKAATNSTPYLYRIGFLY